LLEVAEPRVDRIMLTQERLSGGAQARDVGL
jgi:hypothetical protein